MKCYIRLFCTLSIIMLTTSMSLVAEGVNNVITITPLNRIVSNVQAISKEPLEGHVLKNESIVENDLFSIYIDLGNTDRYVKITSSTTNIDFVRFRRDKNNGYITFKSYNSGKGRLSFQVDSEDATIKKYIYTINITNNITNTSVIAKDEEQIEPVKNINTNITKPKQIESSKTINESSVKKISSVNSSTTKKKITQSAVIANPPPAPKMPFPPNIPAPAIFAQSSIINDNLANPESNATALSPSTSNVKDEDILLYKMAEDLRISKSYDNAIKTYNDIVSRYPTSTNTLKSKIRLAEIYTTKKDYDNAYNTFKLVYEDSMSKDNERAYALYSMGLTKKVKKDYSTAKNNFIEVINKYPKTTYRYDAAYDYVHTLSLENKISDGIQILESALSDGASFDKRENALILLGEIYEKGSKDVRDYKKAYDTYSNFLRDYPNSRLANEVDNRRNFIFRNYLNF